MSFFPVFAVTALRIKIVHAPSSRSLILHAERYFRAGDSAHVPRGKLTGTGNFYILQMIIRSFSKMILRSIGSVKNSRVQFVLRSDSEYAPEFRKPVTARFYIFKVSFRSHFPIPLVMLETTHRDAIAHPIYLIRFRSVTSATRR